LAAAAPAGGDRVLDLGCGPGFVTEDLALAVGPQGMVAAVDNSDSSLAMARHRCADLSNVQVQAGEANQIPFPDRYFDLAVATQVYEFVPDIAGALVELSRVLKPGGRAAIIDTDWHTLLWHSADPVRMARVLRAWDEHLAHPELPRTLGAGLREAGFQVTQVQAIPYLDTQYKTDGFSYNITLTIRRFVRDRQGIIRQVADAWAEELRSLADAGRYFFCLNRFLFVATKQ